jgi:hypothetical protein
MLSRRMNAGLVGAGANPEEELVIQDREPPISDSDLDDAAIPSRAASHLVLLHVYELGKDTPLATVLHSLNAFTQGLAGVGGVFHAAIEVHGIGGRREWSYGHSASGSGVFSSPAKMNRAHVHLRTVELGWATLDSTALSALIERLQSQWRGADYHLMRYNCVTFCEVLCRELHVGPVPEWVGRCSSTPACTREGCSTARRKLKVHRRTWLTQCTVPLPLQVCSDRRWRPRCHTALPGRT